MIKKAFIFDIDGTLAIRGDRSPFDWDRVGEDTVNTHVAELLSTLQRGGYTIIICTGRDEVCEEQTTEWLENNGIFWDRLYMREEGNTAKDAVIKGKMLEHIQQYYDVMGVFDDRNQVVEMWRSHGLQCYQVQDGNF